MFDGSLSLIGTLSFFGSLYPAGTHRVFGSFNLDGTLDYYDSLKRHGARDFPGSLILDGTLFCRWLAHVPWHARRLRLVPDDWRTSPT
jgi:hypothetical protein